MRVACLVSGGKDSILAAETVRQWGWEIESFLTLLPTADAPMLYHRPNAEWVGLQAEAAGLPWRTARVTADEDELTPLRGLLKDLPVDGIVVGALASEYQRTRFEAVCHASGLKTFAPLWHHEPSQHLRDVLAMGIRSRFVHVAAAGLGREWLGRPLDAGAADALAALAARHRLNVAGEGGEYETYVVEAPMFRAPIQIDHAEPAWERDAGTWNILRAHVADRARA